MYFIFILEKCDLSALKSISLSTSSESWDRRTYKRLKSLAVLTKSIPSKVFEKTSSHTTDDFQLCVADLLGKRASALESLTITNNTDDLRMELLTSCSKTLKELDLFGEYKGGKDLELVIPKMPFLRKLNAKFCDGISICSSSLEELCMREPCTILRHSCPGLKKLGFNLKMDYDAQHFVTTPSVSMSCNSVV